MSYYIIGNFGNHSLAAMQFLIETKGSSIHFVYVNTGWAAASWLSRVEAGVAYAERKGVIVHQLHSEQDFEKLVLDRRQFPSPKFQWCASFLKALPVLAFLDDEDPASEALIVSGKRRIDSRRYTDLDEFEMNSELYQGRTLWNPLYAFDEAEFNALIQRAGFELLAHPSLECSPCIHANRDDLSLLDINAVKRLHNLETQIGQTMFSENMAITEQKTAGLLNQFDRGCGAPWGCGE